MITGGKSQIIDSKKDSIVKRNLNEQFNLLLEKYNEGTLTNREKALMDEWVEILGENNSETSLTENEKLELKNNLKAYILKTGKPQDIPATITIKPWYVTPLKIAASILLLAALSF